MGFSPNILDLNISYYSQWDVSWGEFDRTITRGLGEVRAMLRKNFWHGTNAYASWWWCLMSSLARIKSRNSYVEFINRERPQASWYNVIEVQELLMLVYAIWTCYICHMISSHVTYVNTLVKAFNFDIFHSLIISNKTIQMIPRVENNYIPGYSQLTSWILY